jgi:hypothetical protein
MNRELKQQWIDALRSGKYRQGRGALRSDDGEYCALGVLADISPDGDLEKNAHDGIEATLYYEKGEVVPISDLAERVGLDLRQTWRLIDMNDEYGAPFDRIANFIEGL